jgi:hypothetical protein
MAVIPSCGSKQIIHDLFESRDGFIEGGERAVRYALRLVHKAKIVVDKNSIARHRSLGWFKRNDPEGIAFEYEVLERSILPRN